MSRSTFRSTRRLLALVAVVGLLAAGCGRSSDDKETGDGGDTPTTAAGGGGTTTQAGGGGDRLSQGDFGDLKGVCSKGDGDNQDPGETGATADSIKIGVVTDKGSQIRPGLNKEMWDTSVAFSKWCNEHGGIGGRKIELTDLDAKLFDYPAVITTACGEDFAMVGGGAAIDDGDKGAREKCGLPNVVGYAVSKTARNGKLQVFPLPSPDNRVLGGPYRVLAKVDPEAMKHYGALTGDLASIKISTEQNIQAVEKFGGKVVYRGTYAAAGESNWRPFVQDMKSKGVQVFEVTGEPGALQGIQQAMKTEGWYPKYTLEQANFYDSKFASEGGANAKNTYVRATFFPVERADENPATSDYLDLMEQYNPSGKKAVLGLQSLSGWLLFATAAKECGADLTRDCLLEKAQSITKWTGGGLHAETSPADNTPAECFVSMKVEAGKFVYDEKTTDPNDEKGVFNCSPENQVAVKASE